MPAAIGLTACAQPGAAMGKAAPRPVALTTLCPYHGAIHTWTASHIEYDNAVPHAAVIDAP